MSGASHNLSFRKAVAPYTLMRTALPQHVNVKDEPAVDIRIPNQV
jgi:hypothetical protein